MLPVRLTWTYRAAAAPRESHRVNAAGAATMPVERNVTVCRPFASVKVVPVARGGTVKTGVAPAAPLNTIHPCAQGAVVLQLVPLVVGQSETAVSCLIASLRAAFRLITREWRSSTGDRS